MIDQSQVVTKFLNQTDLLPLFQQVSLYFDNNDLQANIGNNSIEWMRVNTTILVYWNVSSDVLKQELYL